MGKKMGIVSRKLFSRYIIPCVFAACIIGFLFSGCAMYDPVAFGFAEIGDDAEVKTTSATQITLEWDPPASSVKSYRIYYREHDAVLWIFLTEILILQKWDREHSILVYRPWITVIKSRTYTLLLTLQPTQVQGGIYYGRVDSRAGCPGSIERSTG
jgi:hypothetical protein